MVKHLSGKTVIEETTEGMASRLLLSSLTAVCVLVGFPVCGSANAQNTANENAIDHAALASLRSQLTNLEQLPLLPETPFSLTADSTQISSTELSEPSFAWIRDQSDERYNSSPRLVEQWSAYTTSQGIRYVSMSSSTKMSGSSSATSDATVSWCSLASRRKTIAISFAFFIAVTLPIAWMNSAHRAHFLEWLRAVPFALEAPIIALR